MYEQAEEIQKEWKKKNTHIMDNIYIKHTEENILILEEIEFSNDKDEGGEDREYIIFKRAGITVEPIPFTTFNKETFYQYDDGELNVVYLPTQERLQEMILKIFSPFAKIIKFSEFVSNYVKLYRDTKYEDLYWRDLYPTAIESMNELWLMYVMYEKYHKIWTGEKWEKEENL